MSMSSMDDASIPEWIQPAWWAPPEGWVGGDVPLEVVLGQSESAAVIIRHLTVYPTGFGFQLFAFIRSQVREPHAKATDAQDSPGERSQFVSFEPGQKTFSGGFDSEESPEDMHQLTDGLRYGVEFEDGRRAERHSPVGGPGEFTILGFQKGETYSPDPDLNIVMAFGSGGGDPHELREERFVWPLPSSGPLAFFTEWPAVGIPEHWLMLKEDVLREALRRARMIWPPVPSP